MKETWVWPSGSWSLGLGEPTSARRLVFGNTCRCRWDSKKPLLPHTTISIWSFQWNGKGHSSAWKSSLEPNMCGNNRPINYLYISIIQPKRNLFLYSNYQKVIVYLQLVFLQLVSVINCFCCCCCKILMKLLLFRSRVNFEFEMHVVT